MSGFRLEYLGCPPLHFREKRPSLLILLINASTALWREI
jgi:hypothetical protein